MTLQRKATTTIVRKSYKVLQLLQQDNPERKGFTIKEWYREFNNVVIMKMNKAQFDDAVNLLLYFGVVSDRFWNGQKLYKPIMA